MNSSEIGPTCINHSFAASGRRRYFTHRLTQDSDSRQTQQTDLRRNTMPALVTYGFASILGLVGTIVSALG
ncbi:hypothetical protein [Pandoraea anapnoica]|uniref:hypothetical protein n=1 Tax=Pandoraea anapnoica TaxID=2508301 RepID=UPI0012414A47|nr:hypothetical protein [Pandoraea anapnoica]